MDTVVVDLVYAGSESRLVHEARARGATVVEGLEVLVRQGARVAEHLDGNGSTPRCHAKQAARERT